MDKIIHYSRLGYNGDFTYSSVCGKKVRTHQDYEECSVHPAKANCKECLITKEYKTDLHDETSFTIGVKRRIYIQSDVLQASEFRTTQSTVHHLLKDQGLVHVERVFSQVLDYAWHHLDETWAAVKNADEIYANSSLVPLVGNSYMGAPVIFNAMCQKAVAENVTGKSVYLLTSLEHIDWYMIEMDIMKKAFKGNYLFTYDKEYSKMILAVVNKIKK